MAETHYNVVDVDSFIADMRQLDDVQIVNLWYSMLFSRLPQHPEKMLERYQNLHPAAKCNVVYRLSQVIEGISSRAAKELANKARASGDM